MYRVWTEKDIQGPWPDFAFASQARDHITALLAGRPENSEAAFHDALLLSCAEVPSAPFSFAQAWKYQVRDGGSAHLNHDYWVLEVY